MDKVKIGFPIEYEDENDIVRNGLFLREPEIKELEKRLKEINKITDLKQQVKKQKEVIDNIKEYIEPLITDKDDKECYPINFYVKDVLLDILKEASE